MKRFKGQFNRIKEENRKLKAQVQERGLERLVRSEEDERIVESKQYISNENMSQNQNQSQFREASNANVNVKNTTTGQPVRSASQSRNVIRRQENIESRSRIAGDADKGKYEEIVSKMKRIMG